MDCHDRGVRFELAPAGNEAEVILELGAAPRRLDVWK